jgi:hypothetical protein
MAPRGLKTLLKKTQPAKLVGSGKFRGFVPLRQGGAVGPKLRGLTKRLQTRFWSDGDLPPLAKRSNPRAGGCWGGQKGGQQRGTRVDAQLTRLINAGPAAWKKQQHVYRLTKMVLSGLAARGLEPVTSQRCAISEKQRIGTAADIVAFHAETNRLVLVELKCGYDNGRKAPAEICGKPCKMQAPLSRVSDCNVHRHLLQLCVTRQLFVTEKTTLARIGELGVEPEVDALLMYANDAGVEFYELDEWWRSRGAKLVGLL